MSEIETTNFGHVNPASTSSAFTYKYPRLRLSLQIFPSFVHFLHHDPPLTTTFLEAGLDLALLFLYLWLLLSSLGSSRPLSYAREGRRGEEIRIWNCYWYRLGYNILLRW